METDGTTGIQTFVRGDDDDLYETSKDGYVLVERKPNDFMLHESDCSHLQLTHPVDGSSPT
jgi:hypothetical protein